MTPRSFFAILIKTIGLYLILQSFSVIPQILSTFYFMFSDGGNSWTETVTALGISLAIVLFLLFFLYICLFRTDRIIDLLRLDRNFAEEKFSFNIHRSTVLTIAVIVIGAIMLIDSLPGFCQQVFQYVQSKQLPLMEYSNTNWIIFYTVKMLIGLFLITGARPVVNFIELRRKK